MSASQAWVKEMLWMDEGRKVKAVMAFLLPAHLESKSLKSPTSSSRSTGEVHSKQRSGARPNRMCDTETC